MIVDVHTHIWESPDQLGPAVSERMRRSAADPWDRPIASTEAHDDAMQPVQHAIIHGFASAYLQTSIPLEQIARYVSRNRQKYLGFAGIDPTDAEIVQTLAQASELGLVGVTISPAAQGFHPTHSRAMALYEHCQMAGLPVMVQTGTQFAERAMMEFAQPYLLDEVARTFPKLRLVLARVGYPWVEQTLVLLGKHRHIYADLSEIVSRPWELYSVLLSSHQQHVIDHLLLGSDFPFFTPEQAITTVYSINTLIQGTHMPSVPREQLRGIVERDALTCLGIKAPQSEQGAAEPDDKRPQEGSTTKHSATERLTAPSVEAEAESPTVKEGIQ